MTRVHPGEPEVSLVVSIDTEEDRWTATREPPSTRNILELPRLHAVLRRLGVRPTYFTTYAVASDPTAAAVLRDLQSSGEAEIGAHLHPWNTPPMREPLVPRNTMLKNLPAELQLAKVEHLTDTLERVFAVRPRSFRAGRYGLGQETVAALVRCGYAIDSSVTPLLNWEAYDEGPNFVAASLAPYRVSGRASPVTPDPAGPLVELPLSCGFTRTPTARWSRVWTALEAPALRRLHCRGLLARTRLLRRVLLNPEVSSARDMLTCARGLISEGLRYLHLTLHSGSLVPGLSPFVGTTEERERIYGSIERFVEGLTRLARVRLATVAEAAMVGPPSGDRVPAMPSDLGAPAPGTAS